MALLTCRAVSGMPPSPPGSAGQSTSGTLSYPPVDKHDVYIIITMVMIVIIVVLISKANVYKARLTQRRFGVAGEIRNTSE